MTYNYRTKGVCSMQITFDLNDDVVTNVRFLGGCNGNLKAIGLLAEGQDAAQLARLLRGNDCKMRGTSCADQFAQAIEQELMAG